MLRVGLDVSSLMFPTITGIGRYTLNLGVNISKMPDVKVTGFYKLSRMKQRSILRKRLKLPSFPFLQELTPWLPVGGDVFHGPDFRLPLGKKPMKVVTIHDLVVFERQLNNPAWADYGITKFTTMIEKSRPDFVISISDFTKFSFLRYFPDYKDRIVRIHHGIDHIRQQPIGKPPFTFPYILYVGALERRKNVAGLVKSFDKIARDFPDHKLVLVGKAGFDVEGINAAIKEAKNRHQIIQLGYVSEVELRTLYTNATLFFYPSFYEGFGFPILEAMALGCPVITSSRGAMREVANAAALTVEPKSILAMAEGLEYVLKSESVRKDLITKGLKRASEFTWENSARQTVEVYKSLV